MTRTPRESLGLPLSERLTPARIREAYWRKAAQFQSTFDLESSQRELDGLQLAKRALLDEMGRKLPFRKASNTGNR